MIFFYLFQDMKIKIKKYAYIHNSISTYVQEVRKKKCRCCRCKENFKEKFFLTFVSNKFQTKHE